MTAGRVQRCLQVGKDRNPEFLFGFALANEHSAVLNVGPAHFQNVADPLTRADAQLHHEAFPRADRAGRPIGVQKLLRPRLTLCLFGFQLGHTPRRVGVGPTQIDAVFHEHTQDAERVVCEVGFFRVAVAQSDNVLALHLRWVSVAHDRREEIEVLVVVQPGTRLQVPIPGGLTVALDESMEGSGGDDTRLVLSGQDIRVLLPEFRCPELMLKFK